MLIITGTGRSGTSALAEFCRQMGHDPGGNWRDDINAGMEDPEVIAINRRLLGGQDLVQCQARIRGLGRSVIKDPRFILDPKLIRVWFEARSDLRLLILLRNYVDVASSQSVAPAEFRVADGHEEQITRQRHYVAEFILQLAGMDIPFRLLRFPEFIGQFERAFDSLAAFGGLSIERQRAQEAWDEWMDPTKIHFGVNPFLDSTLAAARTSTGNCETT